jgi:hypothetical protein
MEQITKTLSNITEGLTATSEAEILPIYYGNELANGAAYTAYRFKRLLHTVREHAGHVAIQSVNAANVVVNHMTSEYPEW